VSKYTDCGGLLLLVFLSMAGTLGFAAQIPRYGAFVYSNLCWSKESGDARGIRVTVLRYPDVSGDHVLFEWSEGPLYERSGYKVSIDSATSHIGFEVDEDATMTTPDWEGFTGEISDEELVLSSGRNPARKYRLPRVQDFSREGGSCS